MRKLWHELPPGSVFIFDQKKYLRVGNRKIIDLDAYLEIGLHDDVMVETTDIKLNHGVAGISYNFTGYALQYGDGHLAGLDHSSGGYAYPVENIQRAYLEKNKSKMEDYLAAGYQKELTLVSITITVEINK